MLLQTVSLWETSTSQIQMEEQIFLATAQLLMDFFKIVIEQPTGCNIILYLVFGNQEHYRLAGCRKYPGVMLSLAESI